MNSHNETFDKLFEELERFSPEINKTDLSAPFMLELAVLANCVLSHTSMGILILVYSSI